MSDKCEIIEYKKETLHSACDRLSDHLTKDSTNLGESISKLISKLGFDYCPFCGVKTLNSYDKKEG